MFWKDLSPPSSGWKNKPSKKPETSLFLFIFWLALFFDPEDGVHMLHQTLSELHSVTIQMAIIFIVTAMGSSDPLFENLRKINAGTAGTITRNEIHVEIMRTN
jgi:hypothetical protein